MAGYYSRFVRSYATLAAPLTDLMRKDRTWTWGAREKAAFAGLKQALTEAPVLLFPDFSWPFRFETNALLVGVGAALMQDQGKGH